jgi:response regulator of citrate/malate metabolism
MKILIIEDSKFLHTIYKHEFRELGELIIHSDFISALNFLKESIIEKNHIDLILHDVILPDINGILGVKIIRAMEEVGGVEPSKIFMLTSEADMKTVRSAVESGCNDYLSKPIDRKTFIEKIKKYNLELPE